MRAKMEKISPGEVTYTFSLILTHSELTHILETLEESPYRHLREFYIELYKARHG